MGAENFLVIHHDEDAFELFRCIIRKTFPTTGCLHAADADQAAKFLLTEDCSIVVAYSCLDMPVRTLIARIRVISEKVPIICVAGRLKQEEVMAAGATLCLHEDDWRELGKAIHHVRSEEISGEIPRRGEGWLRTSRKPDSSLA